MNHEFQQDGTKNLNVVPRLVSLVTSNRPPSFSMRARMLATPFISSVRATRQPKASWRFAMCFAVKTASQRMEVVRLSSS
ncbi:MAG: hypothetical protein HY674_16680 [Chloroflexi bacterium]|nr:hypothetical protein [Chloroflexota bacterium]